MKYHPFTMIYWILFLLPFFFPTFLFFISDGLYLHQASMVYYNVSLKLYPSSDSFHLVVAFGLFSSNWLSTSNFVEASFLTKFRKEINSDSFYCFFFNWNNIFFYHSFFDKCNLGDLSLIQTFKGCSASTHFLLSTKT